MMATMRPYRPRASPKMRIRIMPTKIASCWALARTPASPTIPIAKPAAYRYGLEYTDGRGCGRVKIYSMPLAAAARLSTYERGETANETRGEMLVTITESVGAVLGALNGDYKR